MLWNADLGNGEYSNPIIHADYSDPDVIRVDDTFYMTASSFNYMPGLPILISKDLVQWKLVNYAVYHLPYPVYDRPAHAKGIWAPSIRFYDGKFWIFFGMPDEGIFVTTAIDPYGTWSPIQCVYEGKGFIDPCPIWEEDGSCYVVHGYAKSRIGFNSRLGMFEVDRVTMKICSEDKFIYYGETTQPTIEGPKVYVRDGFYYIFAPAGGVKTGWQTALRSKALEGPYEEKIVMHQGDTPVNGPHQGGLTDTVSGSEWFVHFQDKGIYGRIVHLQPVNWIDGWPIIGRYNESSRIGEPVLRNPKPVQSELSEEFLRASDLFENQELGLQWQWLGNYSKKFYALNEKKGCLTLYATNTTGKQKAIIWESANVVTQKILCPRFETTVVLEYDKLEEGDRAGLIFIGGQYGAIYVMCDENQVTLKYMYSEGEAHDEIVTNVATWSQKVAITLGLRLESEECVTFFYINEQKESIDVGVFAPKGAIWVGAKTGLFAVSDHIKHEQSKAYFSKYLVKP